MKKIVVLFSLILLFLGSGFWLFQKRSSAENIVFLNAYDAPSYNRLKKLAEALKDNGFHAIVSNKNKFKSGHFNIYATDNNKEMPPVIDGSAINFLWLPFVEQNKPEPLRPYDVIVVESMHSYAHLKAINVRVAFIPEAIDITKNNFAIMRDKPMFYGDQDNGFSLSLYLAGPTDLGVDVFGKGFSGLWGEDEIMKRAVKNEDFQHYPLVLVDQSEEEIREELISPRLKEVIEKGGLPYIRYNHGVTKMFGEAIPMYTNEDEFLPMIKNLLSSPQEIMKRREDVRSITYMWNSDSQAKKFIELFEVMNKKLRLK